MKKILALLLAVVMCFGFLAACAETEEPPPPPLPPPADPAPADPAPADPGPAEVVKSERQLLAEQYGLPYTPEMDSWEPITFTYFDRNPGEPPAADNPIIKIIEEITNVKIEWQLLVGDLETAMGVMLAGGDVPDMAFFGGEVAPAIDSGHFMPIDDLIEQNAPRLRAHYDPWWEIMKYTDGRIYTAEIYGTTVGERGIFWQNQSAFWLQKDVLDWYGKAPTDLDEYFEVINAYKEEFPEIDGVPTTAFLIESDGWRNFSLENGGLFLGGFANWGPAINTGGNEVDSPMSPDVHGRWTNEYQYRYWKKLNEEFLKGTWSIETLTLTHDDYCAEIAKGAVLGFHDQGWSFSQGEQPLLTEGRPERQYLPLGLTFDGLQPRYLDRATVQGSFTGNNGINISANCADPVRAIQYLDYMVDEAVQRFLYWGIEGEHYFYDENGRIARPQEQRDLQRDTQWGYDNLGRFLRNAMPKMQGTYPSDGNATDDNNSPEEYFAGLSAYDQELFAKLGIQYYTGLWGEPFTERPIYYPYWGKDPADGSPAQLASAELEEVYRNSNVSVSQVVTAPEGQFEARYQALMDAVLAVDVQPLLDDITEKAEAIIAAMG